MRYELASVLPRNDNRITIHIHRCIRAGVPGNKAAVNVPTVDRIIRLALMDRCKREAIPCVLCGQPFDWSLRSPHPYSFTAHHAIARAHGGDHSPDNMLPAHKICNEKHGTKPMVPVQPADPHSEEWP